MNKTLRFVLVLIVLAGIVFAASSKAVWATPASGQPAAAPAKANDTHSASGPRAGTVDAPNCSGVLVQDKEEKSICGIALVTGSALGTDVFASLNGMPSGMLSQAVTLFFKSGSAQICFAAPNGGTIYFMASGTFDFVTIPTDLIDGFACSLVSANGDYALGLTPAP